MDFSGDDKMEEYLKALQESTKDRKYPFKESMENLMAAKSAQYKRFTEKGDVNVKVCILGDQIHVEEAKRLNMVCMDENDLRKLNKDKKLIEELVSKYDVFLASETIVEMIPEILSPGLDDAGKTLVPLFHNECMAEKVTEIKNSIGLKMKNLLCMLCMDGSFPQT